MYTICSSCKQVDHSPPTPIWLCDCGKPREVHYDWEGQQRPIDIIGDNDSLWRYQSILPAVDEMVTLGEGKTPLLQVDNNVWIKDETVNPTGSFKDRGMGLAVTMAKAQSVESICLPSAGNAGVSAAAYCQKAGIDCHVFLPETIPIPFKDATEKYGANLVLSGNTISDAAKTMLDQKENNWFDISTLKEPFRVEGKKTLGYEIAEQMEWTLPEVIIYPTGGGTGLIGMWKAFHEMAGMGWIDSKMPRMVAAQSDGCAPVVSAFQAIEKDTVFWDNSDTIALGLNVPGPLGGHWILDILAQSNGIAVSAPEQELNELTHEINGKAQMNASAEVGAVWSAYLSLKAAGWINANDKVVLFATGIERC